MFCFYFRRNVKLFQVNFFFFLRKKVSFFVYFPTTCIPQGYGFVFDSEVPEPRAEYSRNVDFIDLYVKLIFR